MDWIHCLAKLKFFLLLSAVCAAQNCVVPSSAYGTIQSAVDDPSCGVVEVQAGTFLENLDVQRSTTLQLRGAGLGLTLIDGSSAALPVMKVQLIGAGTRLVITDVAIGEGVNDSGGAGLELRGIEGAGPLVLRRVRMTRNQGTAALQARTVGQAVIEDSLFDRNVGQVVFSQFGGGGTDYVIRRSTFEENTSPAGEGDITLQVGDLTMTDSLLINNAHCGAIGASSGTIERVLVQGNAGLDCSTSCSVSLDGGALRASTIADNGSPGLCTSGPRLVVENTTISGNDATDRTLQAGGFDYTFPVAGFALLRNVTLVNNSSGSGIGGIRVSNGSIALAGSLVAANDGVQCVEIAGQPGSINSLGHNLDSDGSCSLDAATDLPAIVDPRIGPLQDNGGPTPTHALASDSPAVDAAGGPGIACPSSDQRGVVRPQGVACDIGAFEREP